MCPKSPLQEFNQPVIDTISHVSNVSSYYTTYYLTVLIKVKMAILSFHALTPSCIFIHSFPLICLYTSLQLSHYFFDNFSNSKSSCEEMLVHVYLRAPFRQSLTPFTIKNVNNGEKRLFLQLLVTVSSDRQADGLIYIWGLFQGAEDFTSELEDFSFLGECLRLCKMGNFFNAVSQLTGQNQTNLRHVDNTMLVGKVQQ